MATAPNLIPPFVTAAEVTKDRALRLVLADVFRELKKLCEQVDDTLMLVGSEVWMAALSFYQTVRQARLSRRRRCRHDLRRHQGALPRCLRRRHGACSHPADALEHPAATAPPRRIPLR